MVGWKARKAYPGLAKHKIKNSLKSMRMSFPIARLHNQMKVLPELERPNLNCQK